MCRENPAECVAGGGSPYVLDPVCLLSPGEELKFRHSDGGQNGNPSHVDQRVLLDCLRHYLSNHVASPFS